MFYIQVLNPVCNTFLTAILCFPCCFIISRAITFHCPIVVLCDNSAMAVLIENGTEEWALAQWLSCQLQCLRLKVWCLTPSPNSTFLLLQTLGRQRWWRKQSGNCTHMADGWSSQLPASETRGDHHNPTDRRRRCRAKNISHYRRNFQRKCILGRKQETWADGDKLRRENNSERKRAVRGKKENPNLYWKCRSRAEQRRHGRAASATLQDGC